MVSSSLLLGGLNHICCCLSIQIRLFSYMVSQWRWFKPPLLVCYPNNDDCGSHAIVTVSNCCCRVWLELLSIGYPIVSDFVEICRYQVRLQQSGVALIFVSVPMIDLGLIVISLSISLFYVVMCSSK